MFSDLRNLVSPYTVVLISKILEIFNTVHLNLVPLIENGRSVIKSQLLNFYREDDLDFTDVFNGQLDSASEETNGFKVH